MNWLKNQWALLRKYGFAFSVVLQTSISVYFFVRAFMEEDALRTVCYVTFGVMFLMMDLLDIVTANLRNGRDICKADLDDANDKLILAEHDVERLKLELEIMQAALEETQKLTAKASAETPSAGEPPAESQSTEPKPRPKRPAFKRKPKPKTESVNENQN